MSDISDSSEDAIRNLEAQGYRVDAPGPYDMFLDLDTEEQYATFQRAFQIYQNYFGETDARVTPSPSGLPHRHVRIRHQRKLSPTQRIAFQAALGSDPVRELLSLLRVDRGDPFPTLLKENK